MHMQPVYGLVGKKLTHSFSKKYFTQKFALAGSGEVYELFELESAEAIRNLISDSPNLMGLNVTIPYKEEVTGYLDGLDSVAREIGAVNTIKILRGATLQAIGYNTDWLGFTQSLQPLLKPWHKKALILGTGGAARAVAYSLARLNISYRFVSRAGGAHLAYTDITGNVLKDYTVIINTTPLGTAGELENECPAIDYNRLTRGHLAYDLVYNPPLTLFMERAQARGAAVKNGYEMLQLQAEAAYKIWTT